MENIESHKREYTEELQTIHKHTDIYHAQTQHNTVNITDGKERK